jgi:cytidylate kinase
MKKKINIAIDGYSSTGKSTIAKKLAEVLGYVYVDTGAMYRAVTYFAVKNDLISKDYLDKEKLISMLDQIDLKFVFNKELGYSEIYLNGENVEKKIRNLEISNLVSRIAEVSEVRKKLVEQQKKIGVDKGVVMDGRDIGTVVFPDAELKIFMTATAEKRAQRRFKEMTQKGEKVAFEEVFKNVNERDQIDTSRKDSPLVKADDAILLDNSDLDAEQTFVKAMELVTESLE